MGLKPGNFDRTVPISSGVATAAGAEPREHQTIFHNFFLLTLIMDTIVLKQSEIGLPDTPKKK
jgi:hypothetical protein